MFSKDSRRMAFCPNNPLCRKRFIANIFTDFACCSDVNKNNVVVQGIIDCCFTENNEWVIVDYKTTSTRDKDPRDVANSYRMQLQIYADALQKLSGLPVKETWVYLLSAGEAFRVSREQA